jgi:hypothetical protein
MIDLPAHSARCMATKLETSPSLGCSKKDRSRTMDTLDVETESCGAAQYAPE